MQDRTEVDSKIILTFHKKAFSKPFELSTLNNILEVEEVLNSIERITLKDGTMVGVRFHFSMGTQDNGPH